MTISNGSGAGTFNTIPLANAGSTTLTITNISNGTISMAPSGSTTATITTSTQPASGTLTKTPNTTSVCSGSSVSATATAGTGGTGTVADVLEYRYDGGSWQSYTSGTILSTAGHTSVDIRTYRTASGTGCTQSIPNMASWVVNARPTVSIGKSETSGTTNNDGIICTGSSVTLTGNGSGTLAPYSYSWVTGATTIASTQSVPVSPTSNTDYLVTVTDGNGCTNTETFTVEVNSLPTPGIAVAETSGTTNNDGTICTSDAATLTASGGTSYAWNTGATGAVLSNLTPGATTSYTVTVTNVNGCSATASKTITVNPLPIVPIITGTSSVCIGGTTTLMNSVSGSWTSLNTSIATIDNNSGEVTGVAPGSTTIQFAVTDNNGCTNNRTTTVTVNALPTLTSVSSSTIALCSGTGATITLNGLLPNTTQTIDYTIPGEGTLTTTVTSNGSGVASFTTIGLNASNSGAQLTITGITRNDVTPSCSILPSNAGTTLPTVTPIDLVAPVIDKPAGIDVATLCAGQTLTVDITTPGSGGTTNPQDEYRYSTDGGANWSAWSTTVPSFAAVTGTNSIQARRTAADGTCTASGTNSKSWVVTAQPSAGSLSPAVQDACLNTVAQILTVNPSGGSGNFSYQWYANTTNSNTGGNLINGETNSTYTPPTVSVGTIYYYAVVTNTGTGCNAATSATASVSVDAQPVSGTIAKSASVNTTSVCSGSSVSATATAGTGTGTDLLEYSFDDSGIWSTYTAGANLSTAGHTKVEIRTYRSAAGTNCTSSTPVSVSWVVNARPTVSIGKSETSGTTNNDGIICTGSSVTLTGNGSGTLAPYSYSWVTGATTIASTQSVPVSPTSNTDYLVTVTDGNGCTNTETFTVEVNSLPTPGIAVAETSGTTNNDGTICTSDAATLTASGGTSYAWNTGATGAVLSNLTPGATTSYTVTVTNVNGCSATASKTITVNPLPIVTFIVAPGTSTCIGTSVTYTTQAGQSNYNWILPTPASAYTITGGGLNTNSITVQWNTVNNKMVIVGYKNSDGCTATSSGATVLVNPLPTISTSGAMTPLCESTAGQTTTLSYTATSNSPTSYSIDWNAAANSAGLTDQGSTNFSFAGGGGNINTILVSANTQPGSYAGIMTITNANGCTATQAVSLVVTPTNTVGAASATPTLCISTALTPITHSTTGATGIGTPAGLPAGVTAGFASNTITILGTPTVNGTFNYSIPLTGGCGLISATGTITVTSASIGGTIAQPVTTVCANAAGGTLTLSGHNGSIVRWESSTNGGTSWTQIANTTTSQTYSTTVTTLYRVFIQNGVCSGVYSSNAVVSVIPTYTPTATATPAAICVGQSAMLSATAGFTTGWGNIDGTFNQANPDGWQVTENGSHINFPANANNAVTNPWSESNGPKTLNGVIYNNLQTNGKFAVASGVVSTFLETPVFNTIGMGSALLQFYQAYNFNAGTIGKIEISTNGGASYNHTLITYNGAQNPNLGNPTNSWVLTNLDLSSYLGLTNLRIRFNFQGVNGPTISNWAIDGMTLPGSLPTITYAWMPTTGLTPTAGQTVTASPTTTTTYTLTTTVGGCPGGSNPVTVTVNPLPTATVAVNATAACQNGSSNAVTFTGADGTAPYTFTYNVNNGANQTVTTTSGNSITIQHPTGTAGAFTYNLVSVRDGSSTQCAQPQTGTVTINVYRPVLIANTAPLPPQCWGSKVTLTFMATGDITGYQWYKNNQPIIGATSNSYVINAMAPADAGDYYLLIKGTSPCLDATSGTINLTTYATDMTVWTSGANTDEWHDDLNWTCKIPNLYRDALVPVVPNNKYPHIDGTSGLVGQTRNLTIDANTSVTLDGLLQMAGTVTNNGILDAYLNGPASKGMLEFVSNINFSAYPNNTLDPKSLTGTGATETQHLKISNTVTFAKLVDVYGQLSFGGSNKSLATGDKLTLKSVSSTVSAMVMDRTNGIGVEQNNTISGQVTVERFIDGALGRKWRLVTAPVKGININQAWQEGMTSNNGAHKLTISGTAVTPIPKYGTLITGGGLADQTPRFTTAAAANAAGFDFWDAIALAQSSLRYYAGNADWTAAIWQPVASTIANNFNANQAYLLFVRGDRSITSASGGTTLRPKGLLKEEFSHDVPVNAGNSHTLVGNPYAAPLDFHKMYSDAKLGNKTTIQPYFWIWQASLTASFGGYAIIRPQSPGDDNYEMVPDASMTGGPPVPPVISSGQGFFVVPLPNVTNPKITINQTHKALANSTVSVFRQLGEKPKKLFVNVYAPARGGREDILLDGVLAEFSPGSKPQGLTKALQAGENLSVQLKGSDYIVSTTDLPRMGDTVHLRLWNTAPGAYKLRVRSANFTAPGLAAILVDKFLQKETPLSLGDAFTEYSFNRSGQAASGDEKRFVIVFRSAPLPVVTLEAAEKRAGVQLQWQVPEEVNVARYELERSTDGTTFATISTTLSQASAAPKQYTHFDKEPFMQVHYRVKLTGVSGATVYSNTVTVNLVQPSGFTVYPNPVLGRTANLRFTTKPEGRYNLQLFAPGGQQVASQVIQHMGGTATYELQVGNLASGTYTAEIHHPGGWKEKIKLVITH
ncbi:hypothetical protein HRG84_22955 [Flavisolibacter sp. BT320]|nr:hypothetical protein [Flavisolibacter longurius]